MLSTWYKKFSSQPHQPFFTSGMLLLITFTAVLLGVYSGFLDIGVSVINFHAYPMIFIIFIQFFLGFLFVVFPRFLMQPVLKPELYMKHFFIFLAGSLLYIAALFISDKLLIAASILLIAAQTNSFLLLLSIYRKSIVKDKYDTRWVLIAYASGIVAHLFFIAAYFATPVSTLFENIAIKGGFYLFLFTVVFAISQRMIPHFTQVKVQGYQINKTKKIMEIIFSLLVVKVALLLIEPKYSFLADIPLFIFFVREFAKWKLPVTKVPAIIWVLYLSLAWIPVGFLISAIESLSALAGLGIEFEKAALHAFAVGYFLTILIGFGTRVVLGHSGRVPTADKPAIAIFLFIQVVALSRIFAALSLNLALDYTFLINLSATLMLAALLAWCARYFRILAISF
ncbi:NnrS family protein [Nitrosophilus alvini]|uniref:NnrS family protein n=1 Tax=Nitrosophilus alvini TaxID=2714855 RepID=UPI00190B6598|nr:NnrS family protein [Nitrosophilus alvini]